MKEILNQNENQIENITNDFENLLLKSKKINEGKNGIINLIETGDLPPDVDSENKQLALKILKIYTNGKGKREFEMQKAAFDIINNEQELPVAKIPKPIMYKELRIQSEELRQKLTTEGIEKSNDKIELLLMDLMPGEDLSDYLFRETVKVAQAIPLLKQKLTINKDASEMDIKELEQEIKILFDGKITLENSTDLLDFLGLHGHDLPDEWLKKIENTINLLNKNNIFHNDLHERNTRINFGKDIYIFDFGGAGDLAASDKQIFNEKGNRVSPDFEFINKLKKQNNKKNNKARLDESSFFTTELAAIKSKIINHEKWIELLDKLKSGEFFLDRDLAIYDNTFNKNSAFFMVKFLILLEASASPVYRQEVLNFINKEIEGGGEPDWKRGLEKLLASMRASLAKQ